MVIQKDVSGIKNFNWVEPVVMSVMSSNSNDFLHVMSQWVELATVRKNQCLNGESNPGLPHSGRVS